MRHSALTCSIIEISAALEEVLHLCTNISFSQDNAEKKETLIPILEIVNSLKESQAMKYTY